MGKWALLIIVLWLSTPRVALAQAWNSDARTIGLGGIGGNENIFAASVAEARGDRSISIPLGLFQTLGNLDLFKPGSTAFDPSRAVEFASNPLHLQFGRMKGRPSTAFAHAIRNASLSRDLNDYRGFVPESFAAGGLIAPKWGRSFGLGRSSDGPRHALYAGAGPHLALRAQVDTDPAIRTVLDADEPTYLPQARLHLDAESSGQLAAAITGGYRGRFPLQGSPANTAFVSVNANYLHGFRLEDVNFGLRLDTDGTGRLASGNGARLAVERTYSKSGRGMSFDIGAGVVLGRWEVGASANNFAHRMSWRGATFRQYASDNLFSGVASFITSPAATLGTIHQAVASDYRGNVSYRADTFSVSAEVSREWDKPAVRGGLEHVRKRYQVRLATTLVENAWYPTAGVSVRVTKRVWLDLAGFTTDANVERQRRIALASSVRISPR